jgi:hypothetical protein
MLTRQAVLIVLIVALLVAAVQPGRAEAIEPTTLILIAGAGVVVLVIVAYLVIANIDSSRRSAEGQPDEAPVLVALVTPAEAP